MVDDNKQTFEYTINRYTLFDLEDFDFRFVLANVRIESNKPINISLSAFKTSEGVQLNDIKDYISAIEQAGYNFENYPIVSELKTSSTILDALLFIPIKDESLETLNLDITLYPLKTLNLDLEHPTEVGIIENLMSQEPIKEEGKSADIAFVRNAMIGPEQFYHLDASGIKINSDFTSQSQILGVKVFIKNLKEEDLKITKAYAVTKTGEYYIAVDNTYLIDGIDNIAEKSFQSEITGYLFFEALGQSLTTDDFASINIYLQDSSKEMMMELKLEGVQ